MSVETRKVLDMLTEGKINAADAEKLLDKLQGTGSAEADPPTPAQVLQGVDVEQRRGGLGLRAGGGGHLLGRRPGRAGCPHVPKCVCETERGL